VGTKTLGPVGRTVLNTYPLGLRCLNGVLGVPPSYHSATLFRARAEKAGPSRGQPGEVKHPAVERQSRRVEGQAGASLPAVGGILWSQLWTA